MFYPTGFTVIAHYSNGNSQSIAVLDDLEHAIDYAKGCESIYGDILTRTVYTVKQNFPDYVYN